MKKGKLIIVSAPSGCGKSTIINRIMSTGKYDLAFSVSATNRSPRPGERHGISYYFINDDEFREHIRRGDFVEYEEVYPGRFYGTLRSEIESKCAAGHTVILDIDVKGGVNVKKIFGNQALSIFIQPPDIEALRQRLIARATDSAEIIEQRVGRAEFELTFAPEYDCVVVNDDLDAAVAMTENIISNYINE